MWFRLLSVPPSVNLLSSLSSESKLIRFSNFSSCPRIFWDCSSPPFSFPLSYSGVPVVLRVLPLSPLRGPSGLRLPQGKEKETTQLISQRPWTRIVRYKGNRLALLEIRLGSAKSLFRVILQVRTYAAGATYHEYSAVDHLHLCIRSHPISSPLVGASVCLVRRNVVSFRVCLIIVLIVFVSQFRILSSFRKVEVPIILIQVPRSTQWWWFFFAVIRGTLFLQRHYFEKPPPLPARIPLFFALGHRFAFDVVCFASVNAFLTLLWFRACTLHSHPFSSILIRRPQRLFKELFYRKGFQYDNMFDWTVLNLQNERCRSGGGGAADQRPVSATR